MFYFGQWIFNATMVGHEPWDVVSHCMLLWCDVFFQISLTVASKGVE